MPEIAEIARIVHFIKKTLVSKTLSVVQAADDPVVYGKAGTSGAEFQKAMTGKKVVDAGQQGKYFWMVMSSPPHPVMHFGMAGWLKIRSEDTYYYKPDSAKGKKMAAEEWPPKYWKFLLETKEEPKVEAAFVDFRRFARIRLVDCKGSDLRRTTPLKENGPDPVQDKDMVSVEWLKKKCMSKKVPIKAMLLDQAVISGIGNWVGDEVMFNAKMHPEQYCNTLSDDQIKQLHKSIHYVCKTAVDLLGDSDQFPETWLFKHRWAKGKKDSPMTLPTGEKLAFLTVGGRTSCVVPSIQKKTGPVAKEMDEAVVGDEKPKAKAGKKRKSAVKDDESDEEEDEAPVTNGHAAKANGKSATKGRKSKVKEETDEEDSAEDKAAAPPKAKKMKNEPAAPVKKAKTSGLKAAEGADAGGRRRSGRASKSE